MALSPADRQALRALGLNEDQGRALIQRLREEDIIDPALGANLGRADRNPPQARAIRRGNEETQLQNALAALNGQKEALRARQAQGENVASELAEVNSIERGLKAQLQQVEQGRRIRPRSIE